MKRWGILFVAAAAAAPWGFVAEGLESDPACRTTPNSVDSSEGHAPCDLPIPHHHRSNHPLCEHMRCLSTMGMPRAADAGPALGVVQETGPAPVVERAPSTLRVTRSFPLPRPPPA